MLPMVGRIRHYFDGRSCRVEGSILELRYYTRGIGCKKSRPNFFCRMAYRYIVFIGRPPALQSVEEDLAQEEETEASSKLVAAETAST